MASGAAALAGTAGMQRAWQKVSDLRREGRMLPLAGPARASALTPLRRNGAVRKGARHCRVRPFTPHSCDVAVRRGAGHPEGCSGIAKPAAGKQRRCGRRRPGGSLAAHAQQPDAGDAGSRLPVWPGGPPPPAFFWFREGGRCLTSSTLPGHERPWPYFCMRAAALAHACCMRDCVVCQPRLHTCVCRPCASCATPAHPALPLAGYPLPAMAMQLPPLLTDCGAPSVVCAASTGIDVLRGAPDGSRKDGAAAVAAEMMASLEAVTDDGRGS